MVNTHRAMDSELLQTRADLLHNRQVLRSQPVVRNGFSRLLLDHAQRSPPGGFVLTGNPEVMGSPSD
jgi:hypothetical protein